MMKRKKEKNDPNKLPKNFGKLMYAGDYDRIKEIFKTCSLEATFGFEEMTAIFFATMVGTDEMIEWLAEQGADINARDRWGQTPLHAMMWVIKYEPLHRMELLIRLGADIHAALPEGETPLHYAAGEGKLQSVKMLVENNADIYAENKRGENPMEYMLAKAYYCDICRILPVAQYFLSIGVPVREKAVRSVRGLAVRFEFYRAVAYQKRQKDEKLLEEALQRLLELFDVPAPSPKRSYDGKTKITAAQGSWQEQFEELFLWIISPLDEKAGTVQEELIRLSADIYTRIRKNNLTEWSEIGTRVMFHSFLRYLHKGDSLSKEEIREAKLAIREIVHKEQILHPEKLCELSVRWIQKNPDPIPLRITFYSS